MKRFSAIFFTLLLLILLAACGGNGETSLPPPASNTSDSSDMVENQETEGPLATPTPPSGEQDTLEPSPTPNESTSTPSGTPSDKAPSAPVPNAPTPTPQSSGPDEAKPSSTPSRPVPSPNPSAPAAPTEPETPPENPSGPGPSAPGDEGQSTALQIQVQGNGHTIVFELNDSPAAQSLYNQLPLSIEVQDYSTNEKIFYPPETLDTADAIPAEGPAGTLAYFSPWGNVVMYYSSCGPYDGLYELGIATSGSEWIETLSGTLQIQKASNT